MTTFFRCIGIPCRYAVFHILSGTFGVVGGRKVGMQFAKVGAVISGIAENITHTHSILTQGADGTARIAIQWNTTLIRIHSRQQRTTVGTAQRAVAHGRCQYHRLPGKIIQAWGMHRVIPKVHFLAKTFLAPELHHLVTVLVGKNVNDIRLDGLFRLRGFTALQGEQT